MIIDVIAQTRLLWLRETTEKQETLICLQRQLR